MKRSRYTPEIEAYIREANARGMKNRQLLEELRAKFDFKGTLSSLYTFKCDMGINMPVLWTPEVKAFLKEQCKLHDAKEMAVLIAEKFNFPNITPERVKGAISRYGYHTGRTGRFEKGHVPANKGKEMSAELRAKVAPSWFKKGHMPHTTLPVGTEIISSDGYHMVKVRDECGLKACQRWRPKHQLIWEEHNHRKVPEGMLVIFLDGNKDNLSPDNLELVDRNEQVRLSQDRHRFKDKELTRTALTLTRLNIALHNKEKNTK